MRGKETPVFQYHSFIGKIKTASHVLYSVDMHTFLFIHEVTFLVLDVDVHFLAIYRAKSLSHVHVYEQKKGCQPCQGLMLDNCKPAMLEATLTRISCIDSLFKLIVDDAPLRVHNLLVHLRVRDAHFRRFLIFPHSIHSGVLFSLFSKQLNSLPYRSLFRYSRRLMSNDCVVVITIHPLL